MPQQQPDQEQQHPPSEVQIILDDALTDLEALVDRYLPGTSRDGGFAGRMMAALEQVGASATQSIGGVVEPLLVSPSSSPSSSPSGSPRRSSGRGGQPTVRSRSNASGHSRASQYSESSVEVSYDERTDDSAYDTHDTRSCYSSGSASEELKPVTAVVVRNRDKSRSNNGAMGKDELMNQTIDTAANTTVDALDTSYFTQDDEAEEPATIPTAAPSPSSKVVTDDMDMDMDETAEIDRPLPESPRRRAEREADEAAERLAHRSYFSKMSSFDQLLDEGASANHHKTDETPQTNTQTNIRPAPPELTNGKTVADKTQHELVQKYRLEKKQQMVAEVGTAPDDEFAIDAGVERRREERRAEERRRLAAVAEHRRRLKYNAQKLREANAAAAAATSTAEKKTDKAGTPPPGLNASDDGESTDDSLADELQSMVVTDLD